MEKAIRELADRLRSMPQSRLARVDDRLGGQTLSAASHELAQWCAGAAAGVGRQGEAAGLKVPVVPRLSDLACGDQVQVLGRELIAVLATVDGATPVWLEGSWGTAAEVGAEFAERVDVLRASA